MPFASSTLAEIGRAEQSAACSITYAISRRPPLAHESWAHPASATTRKASDTSRLPVSPDHRASLPGHETRTARGLSGTCTHATADTGSDAGTVRAECRHRAHGPFPRLRRVCRGKCRIPGLGKVKAPTRPRRKCDQRCPIMCICSGIQACAPTSPLAHGVGGTGIRHVSRCSGRRRRLDTTVSALWCGSGEVMADGLRQLGAAGLRERRDGLPNAGKRAAVRAPGNEDRELQHTVFRIHVGHSAR